jgi:hypothetical protein
VIGATWKSTNFAPVAYDTNGSIRYQWWKVLLGRNEKLQAVRLESIPEFWFKVVQYLSTTLEDNAIDAIVQDPSNLTSKREAWASNGQGRCGLEKHKKKASWRLIVDYWDEIF